MSGERRKRKRRRGVVPPIRRAEQPAIPGATYGLNAVGIGLIVIAALSGAPPAIDVACFGLGFASIVASAVLAVRTGALGYRGAPGQYSASTGIGGDGGGHHGGADVGGALGGFVGGDFGGGGGGHGGGGHGGG